MVAAGRQDATGGASALQLFTAITDPAALSFQVTGTVSGWVFARQFAVCIDANTPSEEKILCSTIAGANPATVNVLTRGYDGTVPTTHGSGAVVTHVLPAAVVMDTERHIYVTTDDDHTQYLTSVRHGSPTLHQYGTPATAYAFGAGTTTPSQITTTADPGSGDNPARDDHVHTLATGAVNTFAIVDPALLGVTADIQTVQSALLPGTSAKFARADHVHTPPAASLWWLPAATGSPPASPVIGQVWWDTTKKVAFVWSGTAWEPKFGSFPYGRISAASQTPTCATATFTVLNFDTADYNTFNIFTTTRFTVPAGYAGVWHIDAGVNWQAGTDATRRYCAIRVNGLNTIADDGRPAISAAGVGTQQSVSTDWKMAVGDYAEVVIRQDSAGTLSLTGLSTHFAAGFRHP